MSNKIIRKELETKLKAWADAQSPQLQIAFENVGFTKPATVTTPFLEAILIPNKTLNKDISGSRKTYLGIFQVNCWAPKNMGTGPVYDIAQAIVDLFPIVPKSTPVSVEETPYLGRMSVEDSNWVIVPVSIRYRYETTS